MPSYISKLTLPSGGTYDIKDEYARNAIEQLSPTSGYIITQLTFDQYNNLAERDDNTIYFISSANEPLIAIGSSIYANYVPASCTSLQLNMESITLATGESFTLVATTEPANPSDPLTFTSNNNNVSISTTSYNNRRLITAESAGTSTVTVTCGGVSRTCQVSIHEPYTYTEYILAQNYSPNGAKFTYTAPISLADGNYIEISIDLSTVTGTKENILSVGQNINTWQGANTGSRFHMYLTASNRTKLSVDLIKDTKAMRPTYTLSGNSLLVKVDRSGVWLDGSLFLFDTEPRITPTLSYDEGIAGLLGLSSFDIGSQEGSNRSHATYNYIKYYVVDQQ